MKKTIMLLEILGILIPASRLSAQNKTVTLKNDSIYQDGKALFACLEKDTMGMNIYYIMNPDESVMAQLAMQNNSMGTIPFTGIFPDLSCYYACSYQSNATIEDILESYFKNKVIVNGKPSMEGLTKYCEARNLSVLKIGTDYSSSNQGTTNSSQNSQTSKSSNYKNPSSSNTSTKSTPTAQTVSFTLKNNSSNNVKIFIGTKPKYGSGTTGWVSGNSINSEHGSVGDQLCIVDDSDNPISCMTIGSSQSKVYINKAGTGFGDY